MALFSRSLLDLIRARGAMTVAEYIDLALYHPELGYYARAAQRSGRAGDFFTSVDVGPLFGEMLAAQFAEMWRVLRGPGSETGGQELLIPAPRRESGAATPESRASSARPQAPSPEPRDLSVEPRGPSPEPRVPNSWSLAPGPQSPTPSPVFDLVEAAAGNGRLARDVLDAAQATEPEFYQAIRLHLVERSAPARAEQLTNLGPHTSKLATTGMELPSETEGVVYANELLDALPVHVVTMTRDGLREVYVSADGNRLRESTGVVSTPEIARYLDRAGVTLEPGWRVEVNLAATSWIRSAARRLRRGFIVIIDYGHEASELYSAAHAAGTLTSFRGHRPGGDDDWLRNPGDRDLTAHVDFTSIRKAAEDEGLETLGLLDQTYFLLALGIADRLAPQTHESVAAIRRRLAIKTLMLPGGLGSTHKVLVLAKNVGRPSLTGCARGARLT